jgi:thiol-disulfide isomerase/thioredoxin
MRALPFCLLALGLLGCKERAGEPAPPARYQAVKAQAAPAAGWCDSTFAGAAPRLTLPPLAAPAAGRAQAVLPAGKRVWVNLWATWCAPCLREMPLLLKWREDLRKDGLDVEVLLLSLDEDGEAFTKFLGEHKEFASAKVGRVASQREYEEWVKAYVKDVATPIPLHLLAAADGKMRCLRAGSLREGDYPAARAALR